MKPTAVRPSKSDLNSTMISSLSAPIKTVCSTPNKNQTHIVSPATSISVQPNAIGTSVASSTSSSTSATSSISSASGAASTPRDENHSHANKPISTRDQPPILNSIIPTTAPVAFAAVAKHNTSQHTANEGNTPQLLLAITFDQINFRLIKLNVINLCLIL